MMTIDELRNKADESLKKIKEEGEELIEKLKCINRHMDEQNKKLDLISDRVDAMLGTKQKNQDNPKYTGNIDLCERLDNLVIKNAEEQGKIYDIDRLFWNDGKLFGYDTTQSRIGPWSIAKIEKGGHDYTIKFKFDWGRCELTLACDDFNAIIAEPIRAQVRIGFDMLFGVNPGVVKIMIKTEVERLIKEIERLKNDGKKDNRDC